MIFSTPGLHRLLGQHRPGKHTASDRDEAPSRSRQCGGATLMKTPHYQLFLCLLMVSYCLLW